MPSIKDQSTVDEIARVFTSNGRNKEQALLSVGYSPAYARGGRSVAVYSSELVKAAIKAIDEESREKTGYSVEQCQHEFDQARLHAIALKQPSAEVSAITGKARIHGLDKDVTVSDDLPPPLTAEECAWLRTVVKHLADRGSRPVLEGAVTEAKTEGEGVKSAITPQGRGDRV